MAAQEKKEKEPGGKSSLGRKPAEIDKLKAELSAVKNISVAEFRKLYEETGPEIAGGAWKTKGRGGGKGSGSKGSGQAGKKSAGDGGGGGDEGGKGKGGRKRGRKGKGGGRGGKGRRGKN